MSVHAKEQEKKPKIIWMVAAAAVAVAIIGALAFWYVSYQVPYDEAVGAFDTAAEELEQRNDELDEAVSGLQELMDSEVAPLDSATLDAASTAIGEAQGAKQDVPELPADTRDILEAAEEIEGMGEYGPQLDAIGQAKTALQESIDRRKLVTNPSEQFVIERLTGLPNITGVEAATETNDPNHLLHKSGGYTSDVFFSSDLVDQSLVYPMDGLTGVPAAGTDGGGCVEVFATEDEANQRDAYIGSFDGTWLSAGYHTVVGTCVVRVSLHLTATQQQQLAQTIIDSLTRLG